MDSCEPEGFVGVDVPDPGHRPLVEERRLDRSAATLEPAAERRRREGSLERLAADPGGEVVVELAGLEQEPRAEAPHVAIGDVRPVV